ncbi:prolyl oligopeptidase family serine peptidase [Neisseria sp. ZJ106]|uniref:Prolyl oligopeptidase family serine peptidase n=1 Tax=Neisseria lisongii TaxID=2912188 RepID=A0ABY7RIC9_9NEIS|nr:prolyl oligopeptidase family serine peptidase [Neisseria lisongii]MCF7521555.1 prolyl oligopeptidase family serine peptidase [Neisseria lisongii]WCL71018.1 prolyl oligopeptidase family serine peptidase [Neisseria lisongii]
MERQADSFRHFEQLDTPQTQNFAAEAHAQTKRQFADTPAARQLADGLLQQMQDKRQIPFCQEHRARMYHFHQDSEYPKGVYRVCTSASYRSGYPEWQILFSVADFDELLGDDVYLGGVSHLVEQPTRALLTLSRAGGDTAYTLEIDLAAGTLVEGGFHFPAGKNHVSWRDENSVWVCPAWDERQLTESGYPCEVWLVERGQSFEESTPVYRMDEGGMMVNAWRYLDPQGAPIDLIEASQGFYTKTYLQVSPAGEANPLNLPEDCDVVGYLAGHLLITLRKDWKRANQSYAGGSLLAVKVNRGSIGEACLLFTPSETQALESVETTRRFVVAHILDNVQGRLKTWRFADGQWQEVPLPRLPSGALEITDQPWGGDTVYFAASSFTESLTLYALDLSVMELSVMRRQPEQFDSDGITVQQLQAESADGTQIPYFHVGKAANADTPTLIYVYGGFGVPELPHYLGSIGKYWLETGNAFVLANVRGGGEFGPKWHQAAQGLHKHKSTDDLLAVAHDLAKRGLSSPNKIGLQGGSNGGLVVASAFVRRPQAFGAMVCEMPLTDMLRYPLLSAGASWTDEYGNPQKYDVCREYWAQHSPYHQLAADTAYPPALITTSLSDDRVHPAHALKFYARLKTLGGRAWLYAPDGGGHTGNGTQQDSAEELACVLTFLNTALAGGL